MIGPGNKYINLPFAYGTSWPATNSLTYGRTHIILSENIQIGRLKRKRGQALCGSKSDRLSTDDDMGKPTCPNCLKIAHIISNAG